MALRSASLGTLGAALLRMCSQVPTTRLVPRMRSSTGEMSSWLSSRTSQLVTGATWLKQTPNSHW
eukprot:3750630-Alexandrium_andersonii.AAC.1